MHPATRMLILIVVAGFMVTGRPTVVFAGVILAGVLHRVSNLRPNSSVMRMVLRMRWFFVSLIVLYAWFTPGVPVWRSLGVYSPSREGLLAGLLRCLILITILSLVHWLVRSTTREQLIQGIYWLSSPARKLGLKPEVLAVRLALVLEVVPAIERRLERRSTADREASTRVQRIVSRGAQALETALNEGDRAALAEIELDLSEKPLARDLAIVGALIAGLTLLVLLSS